MIIKKNKLRIGLLWHSISSANLGVGALTNAQFSILESIAQKLNVTFEYVVWGTSGELSYVPNGLNVQIGDSTSLKRLFLGKTKLISEIKSCDLVLDIGEGDSFADIYGSVRFINLVYTKVLVLLLGKPLILSPQTIGPFNQCWTKLIAKLVMKKCHLVYARDHISQEYLQEIGIGDKAKEVIDVAFRLSYATDKKKNEKVRVGINVSGLLSAGGYTKDNQFGLTLDYSQFIHAVIEYFVKDSNNEVWLIPHVIPARFPVEDDRVISRQLKEVYPQINIAPEFTSPSEAKSFISTMDFMTGARMHACIAAFSSGVPVVPAAYSRKFNGLFNSLNYKWIVDCKKDTTEQAIEKIKEGFANRFKLSEEIKAGNLMAQEKLGAYEDSITSLIKTLV